MKQYSPDSARAALLLTNRLVPLDVKPLTAREFWNLTERVDPGDLLFDPAETGAHRLLRPAHPSRPDRSAVKGQVSPELARRVVA